jgi:hypothetical protein
LYVGVCNFFFDFTGLTVRVCFESQRRLWTWTFEKLLHPLILWGLWEMD